MADHASGFDNNVGVGVSSFERQEMVALQNYTMRRGWAGLRFGSWRGLHNICLQLFSSRPQVGYASLSLVQQTLMEGMKGKGLV